MNCYDPTPGDPVRKDFPPFPEGHPFWEEEFFHLSAAGVQISCQTSGADLLFSCPPPFLAPSMDPSRPVLVVGLASLIDNDV